MTTNNIYLIASVIYQTHSHLFSFSVHINFYFTRTITQEPQYQITKKRCKLFNTIQFIRNLFLILLRFNAHSQLIILLYQTSNKIMMLLEPPESKSNTRSHQI